MNHIRGGGHSEHTFVAEPPHTYYQYTQHVYMRMLGGIIQEFLLFFYYFAFCWEYSMFHADTKVVPTNVILQISGVTYCNSYKADIFCRTRHIQRALYHLRIWNISWDMDELVNKGKPTPTRHVLPRLERGKKDTGRLYSSDERTNV